MSQSGHSRKPRRNDFLPLVPWLAAILLWSCAAATLAAQPGDGALTISGVRHQYPLSHTLLYLEDPQQRLTVDEVASAANAARFRPAAPSGTDVNFGYSRSAFWLALPVYLAPDAAPHWLLEIAYASLDRVEVYVPRPAGGFDLQVAGDLQPFSARPFPHRNLVFPLNLVPGANHTIYLKVTSQGNLTIPATLWTPEALAQHDRRSYALYSLYYGMLLALYLYNLLLFLSIREPVFLAYVAFVACMAIGQASLNGFGNQFLWPEWPAWGNIALPSGMAATGFFGAIFTRLFLETRHRFPWLDRAIVALMVAFALAALTPAVLSYQAGAIFTSITGLAFSVVAVSGGVYCLLRGHPGARYFLIAWALLLVGVAVLAMRNMGWLPTTTLTLHAMQIGSALEMLLLSFALADRINVMRREKDLAQQIMLETLVNSEQALEARVAERTKALTAANTRLREKEQQLEHLAHHDSLTGLVNRTVLDDRIEHALARARRNRSCVALLMVDLDGFKPVNDAYGHAVGDQLLVAVAQRLRQCVRDTDTVARLGGDEFVILLEDVKYPEDAVNVADKLIAAIGQPVPLGVATAQVSASIGIACSPQHATDAEELLGCADEAMYAAKSDGRNRWRAARVPVPAS
ncbi:MAG: 7TM diverse intracellular signaling domain-containing protein [Burkholderiales bacterium]